MTEELKEDLKKLKEEMEELKKQLKDETVEKRRSPNGIYIDVGERVKDYVDDVVDGIAEGIHGELEKSIFIGPHGQHIKISRGRGVHKHRPPYEEDDESFDFDNTAKVMSALGQEQRLKILKELMSGGKYANDLQEKLTDIAASTLSSHLNVLEEAGLVVQEKVRGRYLITIPGRSAYKMARRVSKLTKRRNKE